MSGYPTEPQQTPLSTIFQLLSQYYANSSYATIFPLPGLKGIAGQEGLSLTSYLDSEQNWTIGIGHTPAYPGEVWSNETAVSVFMNDVYGDAYQPLENSPEWSWMSELSAPRLWTNIDAAYNMGADNWLEFGETFTAMQAKNMPGVLLGMRQSLWYNQVPDRVDALAYQFIFNTWIEGYLNPAQKAQLNNLINA